MTVIKRYAGPASQLANVHVDLLTGYAYFDRVFEALDSSVRFRIRRAIVPSRVDGRIEFRNVSFGYGDVPDKSTRSPRSTWRFRPAPPWRSWGRRARARPRWLAGGQAA